MPEDAASAVRRLGPHVRGDLVTGNGIAAVGDSITQADADNANGVTGSRSYIVQACMMSGGKLRFVRNAGVSGDRLAQILARLDDDVIAYDPDFCVDLSGTNDIGNLGSTEPLTGLPITQATIRSTKIAIWTALRNARIQVIAGTLTPRSASTGTSAIEVLNAWIRLYCGRHGIPVVDFARAVTDPTSFGWLGGGTTYNTDGVHPNAAGQKLMATQLLADIAYLLPNVAPYVDMFGQTGTTGANMLKTGCFQQDTNADGVSDNWTKAGTATNVTHTRQTVTGIIGKTQRAVATTTAQRYYDQVVPSGALWAVGDRLAFSGMFTSTGNEAGGGTLHAGIVFTGSSGLASFYPLRSFALDVAQWTFYGEVVIPAGTTALDVQLVNTGIGTVEWGQVSLINLTTLGIAS